MDIEKRKSWSLLRYDYYSAGRNEMLLGNYKAAGILLGYAIEASFKHAMIESDYNNNDILNKHEPQVLMKECRSNMILDCIEVSDDFLDYVNNQFKSRYPSLIEKVNNDINSKQRINIIGPLLLSWYDDLMYQIDQWIYSKTQDNLSSCFFRVVGNIFTTKGRLFFHSNYHACIHLNDLIQMINNHPGDNSLIIDELKKGVNYFWSTVTGIIPAQNINNVKYEINFTKRFFYPKWSNDARPTIKLKDWRCIMINLLPWE